MEPVRESLPVFNALKSVGVMGKIKKPLIVEQVNALQAQMIPYMPVGENESYERIKVALEIDTETNEQFQRKRSSRKHVKKVSEPKTLPKTKALPPPASEPTAEADPKTVQPSIFTLQKICEFVHDLRLQSPPLGSERGRVHWKPLALHDDLFTALYSHRSQTVEVIIWAQQKISSRKRQKGYLITFTEANLTHPVYRRVRLVFTRTDHPALYNNRLDTITARQGIKHIQMQGDSPLHSWTVFSFKGKGKSEIKMLFDISEESHKLRSLMKDARLLNLRVRNQLMKDILTLLVAAHESDPPRVRRNLSLSNVETYLDVSPSGEKFFRPHIPKVTEYAKAFVELEEQKHVTEINRFSRIDYEAPENFERMDKAGKIHFYVPSPAEDVWAVGIIFYRLFWNSSKPGFMVHQRKFRNICLGTTDSEDKVLKPIAEVSRGISDLGDTDEWRKARQLTSLEMSQERKYGKFDWKQSSVAFQHKLREESKNDKVKGLIRQMLDRNPDTRIKARDALNELDDLMRV